MHRSKPTIRSRSSTSRGPSPVPNPGSAMRSRAPAYWKPGSREGRSTRRQTRSRVDGSSSPGLLCGAFRNGQVLDLVQRFLHIFRGSQATDGRIDLAVRCHDERGALGKAMINVNTASVFDSRLALHHLEVI